MWAFGLATSGQSLPVRGRQHLRTPARERARGPSSGIVSATSWRLLATSSPLNIIWTAQPPTAQRGYRISGHRSIPWGSSVRPSRPHEKLSPFDSARPRGIVRGPRATGCADRGVDQIAMPAAHVGYQPSPAPAACHHSALACGARPYASMSQSTHRAQVFPEPGNPPPRSSPRHAAGSGTPGRAL